MLQLLKQTHVLILTFLILWLTIASTEIQALSCLWPSFDTSFEEAALVVQGKILEKIDESALYRVAVIDSWKLPAEDEITVYFNAYWGDQLVVGGEHLLFLSEAENGVYEYPLCKLYLERTTSTGEEYGMSYQQALDQLGAGHRSAAPQNNSDGLTVGNQPSIIAVGLVAVVILGGWVLVKGLKSNSRSNKKN